MSRSGRLAGPGAATAAALGLLLLLLAVDFHLDVRGRDAFSWMDPYQYYGFARELAAGRARLDGFELPSIFPLFVLPFVAVSPTIPAALWVNFLALGVLVLCLAGLSRELRLTTPLPLLLLLLVSSPLWTGLSRTLYVEPVLTAVVAVAFWAWLRLLQRPAPGRAGAFAACVALGVMTKTSFPIFLLPAVGAAVLERFASRRDREALLLGLGFAAPLLTVLAAEALWLPSSFGYWTSLGNTAIPVMARIGPTDPLGSLGFYFAQIGRTLLLALTPWLIVAALAPGWGRRWKRSLSLSGPGATLWLWLLGPLALLTPLPVQEPRHVLPCLVPGVLLIVRGLERVSRPRLRAALTAAAAAAAVVQLAAVTHHWVQTPYFLDRPLRLDALARVLTRAEPGAGRAPPSRRLLFWRYRHDGGLLGFGPDEALALSWWAFPGVVYDLETRGAANEPSSGEDRLPFEDPYLTAAFDTYNRRCGDSRSTAPLTRAEVLRNADFVLWRSDAPADQAPILPGRRRVATLERGADRVHVYVRVGSGESLRALAARHYLASHPDLEPEEVHVLAFELGMARALDGDPEQLRALIEEFPVLRAGGRPRRNIYWIAGYPELIEWTRRRIEAIAADGGAGSRSGGGQLSQGGVDALEGRAAQASLGAPVGVAVQGCQGPGLGDRRVQ